MQAQKKRLGRGLAALIGDDTSEAAVVQDIRSLRHMPIELIHASPNNPRKHFADADLDDLANSIREKGLLQPIVVRPRADGEYETVVFTEDADTGRHFFPVEARGEAAAADEAGVGLGRHDLRSPR